MAEKGAVRRTPTVFDPKDSGAGAGLSASKEEDPTPSAVDVFTSGWMERANCPEHLHGLCHEDEGLAEVDARSLCGRGAGSVTTAGADTFVALCPDGRSLLYALLGYCGGPVPSGGLPGARVEWTFTCSSEVQLRYKESIGCAVRAVRALPDGRTFHGAG